MRAARKSSSMTERQIIVDVALHLVGMIPIVYLMGEIFQVVWILSPQRGPGLGECAAITGVAFGPGQCVAQIGSESAGCASFYLYDQGSIIAGGEIRVSEFAI